MNHNPEIHSRRVAQLKLVLPGLAIFLLILLFLFSRAGDGNIQLAIFDTVAPGDGLVLRDPVIRGKTIDNVQYEISAETARSSDAEKAIVDLQNIAARFLPVNASPGSNITATAGQMDNTTGLMVLRDGVTYRNDDGLVVVLIDLHYNTTNRSGHSDKPISGTSPQGDLEATGLEISNAPAAYIFENARLTTYPARNRAGR